MSRVRKILLSDLPTDAPEWARQFVEALNENADALTEMGRAQPPQSVLKDVTFITATPATDTFVPAMKISLPFVPSVLKIVRVQNRTHPTLPASLSAYVDWVKVAGGVLIRNIPGLDDATSYVITLEASP